MRGVDASLSADDGLIAEGAKESPSSWKKEIVSAFGCKQAGCISAEPK